MHYRYLRFYILTGHFQLVDWSILLVILVPKGFVPSAVFVFDEFR